MSRARLLCSNKGAEEDAGAGGDTTDCAVAQQDWEGNNT